MTTLSLAERTKRFWSAAYYKRRPAATGPVELANRILRSIAETDAGKLGSRAAEVLGKEPHVK